MNRRLKDLGLVAGLVGTIFLQIGCSSLKVKMGWKVSLDRTPVSSIQAKLAKGPGVAPGQKSPLVVSLLEPNGQVLFTEGAGHGKVMWRDLQVTASVVKVNAKGIVSLSRDPRKSDGKVGHITITVPSHPELHADLDVPFRYDVAFIADFSGPPGADGSNGMDGINGTSGSMGSIDPSNPSAGGDGSDGTNGDDGRDGGPGGNALPVNARIALRSGDHPMLEASVSSGALERFYLVDTQGGSLMIKADGGRGGAGGRGGKGGRGGSGGMGSPSGSDGHDGVDGRNGFSGTQGKGAKVTVTYDPAVTPYLGLIHTAAVNGPPPDFREEKVGPLW